MMGCAERLSEKLALVATIDPDAYSTGTYYTDAIDMKYFRRAIFVVQVGDMSTNATVDFDVCEGTTTTPTTSMSGKSITQLTQASTDADKQVIVEVAAEELDEANRYIRGKLVIGTAGADAAVVALADVGRYKPESGFDLSSVDEIVA